MVLTDAFPLLGGGQVRAEQDVNVSLRTTVGHVERSSLTCGCAVKLNDIKSWVGDGQLKPGHQSQPS